ncbi:MAG: CHAP domain-containing protein [Actinomycetota bacterium]|nr:CHAP domain-containing protein [Actinomycetota bacterium]
MHAARRLLVTTLTALLATLALATTGTLTSPAAASAASVDDYPYRTDTTQAADQWGFTKRQCVSFAAWRLAQHHVALRNSTQDWGSAYRWDGTAKRLGYRISTRPAVGAIAQWHRNERSPWYANGASSANGYIQAGDYGHVAVVRSVFADGSVLVEQYNMGGSRSYSTMHLKAPRYLYVGV